MPVVNPEFLSHYTSFEVLQKIVEGGTMWATDLRYMNDAAEFRYAIELIESMLDDYPAIKPHTEKVIDIFFDKGESVGNDHSIYSISFSENEDLLSQWRAYCPESGGVSIAFEKTDLEALGSARGCQLIKCIYDVHKQKAILTRVLEEATRIADEDGAETDVLEMIIDGILESAPKMKHQSFAEEREWRLVTAPIGFYEDCVQYRIRKSTFIPYVPLCIMLENRLGFDHVTIGPNQSPELAWFSTRRLLEGQIRQKRLQPKEFLPFPVRESDTPFRAM